MKTIEQIEKELRSKIIESVPEIVELKFGCRLKSNYIATIYHTYEDGTMDAFIEAEKGIVKFTIERIPETTEIIGSPITLSDVLRAIDKNKKSFFEHIFIESDGEIATQGNDDDFPYYDSVWNLSKNLDCQSENTKRFLHSVICK